MAQFHAKIPEFDGKNFSDWKYRMELILQENDLLLHIQNDEITGKADVTPQVQRSDVKARRIISEGLSSAHLEYVKDKLSAYTAWKALVDTFEGKKTVNRVNAFEKLFFFKT